MVTVYCHIFYSLSALVNAFYYHIGITSLAMDLKANEVYEGTPNFKKADCTLTLPDDTFVDLVGGKVDAKKVK